MEYVKAAEMIMQEGKCRINVFFWRKDMEADMRTKIVLECTECHDRNYTTTKNKQKHPERIEIMKYCPRLKKYTLHRETK